MPGRVFQFVLVARAGADARHEAFPHAALAAQEERVHATVPSVEVADDAHAPRVRRPYGERRAAHAVDRSHVRAERVVEVQVVAGRDQIRVEFAEHRNVRRGHCGTFTVKSLPTGAWRGESYSAVCCTSFATSEVQPV